MTSTLWRIEAPHFVAGLIVENGIVIGSAPILHWAKQRQWAEVKHYCARKGWEAPLFSRQAKSRDENRAIERSE